MDYKLASSSWGPEEIDAIQGVIDEGMYSMGERVNKYEQEFASYFGSKYCVMVNSGSSANLLMIAALFFHSKYKLERGDEIIVPTVSWSTTYAPLQQYGLKLKFVDVDLDTLNIDIAKLKSAVSKKTRAIFAVNLLGNPNQFDEINEIIDDKDIILLEDNCESMGAKYNYKFTGTFGLMGSFSSFFSHHISTMEGGCIITDDQELHEILLCLRAHGWTRNLSENNLLTSLSNDYFEESFKFILPGYNLRPLEMSGAIGLEQLKKLPAFLEQRRKNAELFQKKFQNNANLRIQSEVGESSWFGFSIILNENARTHRAAILDKLKKSNIEVRPIVTGNFLKNKKLLKFFDYDIGSSMEASENLESNGFFVGNHQICLAKQIEHLFNVINSNS